MSNGFTDRANSPSSSCAPVFSRQDRHAVALVDERALLRHEVHAVEHRVDDQHVVVLVGGDGLLEVVAQLELDRHPVRRAVAVVDDRDERLDALEVLRVLGHVRPRRHQLRDERDLLAELRVLLEEQVEGGEPAQDVLRQVRAVDAQDQVVAPPAQQLAPRTPARASGAATCCVASQSIGSG